MLALLTIAAMRLAKLDERRKGIWHGIHAWIALGDLVYHITAAIVHYKDHKNEHLLH